MNNNRGNNRRRGRGNNRQQGGQQVNRIDSRARGNAPQLLEKYKKLAHDAHLNGDRVTEEYYLQFADHYFRVIADQRQRQEEARQRRDDRPQDYDRGQDYSDDYGSDDDVYSETTGSSGNGGHDRGQRFEREPQGRAPVEETVETVEVAEPASEEAAEGERSIYEPAENPFVRDNRGARGLKERKPRRRRQDENSDGGEAGTEADAAGFDPSALPPSISSAKPAQVAAEDGGEEKPKRRRTRKTTPPSDDGKLEAVNG